MAVTDPVGEVRNEDTIQMHEGKPSLPIFILTDVGTAIASILPSNLEELVNQMIEKISDAMPQAEIRRYAQATGKGWMQTAKVDPKEPPVTGEPS